MASIFGDASQSSSVGRASEGAQKQLRVLRDGSLVSVDWMQALVMEGRVFGVNVGTGTGPTTFNAAYAVAEQDLYLYVPANTVIIPLLMSVAFEDTGTAIVMDVVAGYSLNGDSAVTGTALTIYNYKTGDSRDSGCTATSVITAAGTTHLGGDDFLEIWRPYAGFAEDAFNGSTAWVNQAVHGARWSAKQEVAPIIGSVGTAGALSLYASATASTGFITLIWAELPASAFA